MGQETTVEEFQDISSNILLNESSYTGIVFSQAKVTISEIPVDKSNIRSVILSHEYKRNYNDNCQTIPKNISEVESQKVEACLISETEEEISSIFEEGILHTIDDVLKDIDLSSIDNPDSRVYISSN